MTDTTDVVVKRIGRGLRVDEHVILGYMPGRTIEDTDLVIGADAHVRAGSIIYGGTCIGDDFETGHNVVIREENRIGDRVSIWNNTVIDYGCIIGNRVKIHCNIYVAQFTVLEDDVFMAPGVTIANDMHPGCPHSRECMRGPTIKRGAQLGVNVTVVPFVTIGEGALIGSGSVVTRDIPAGMLAYGNPARAIRPITELQCITGITDKPYK
ncbi:MAG: N-acetyltransferase [Candidatus Eisenbacteria sp.]|nr:N-acetyltransferase [Candidatus Eisenbacteria bacterium]